MGKGRYVRSAFDLGPDRLVVFALYKEDSLDIILNENGVIALVPGLASERVNGNHDILNHERTKKPDDKKLIVLENVESLSEVVEFPLEITFGQR